jgi:hypothetical protein
VKPSILSRLCLTALALGACSDATQPPATQEEPKPSFSHGGPSETTCTGVMTGIHHNVTVPPGQTCFLVEATVLGNVKALRDAILSVDLSTVHGNVEGDGPDVFQVGIGSTVHGNVFVTEAGNVPLPGGGLATVAIGSLNPEGPITTIGGDVHILKSNGNLIRVGRVNLTGGSMKVEENNVRVFLRIVNNVVAQNLQVLKNRDGSKFVTDNQVGQNLQCFENSPPFVGGPNTARQAQGQCFVGTTAAAATLLQPEDVLEQQGLRLTTDERGGILLESTR